MANMEMLIDPFAYMIKLNRPHPSPKRFDHGWRTDMLSIPKGNKDELQMFTLSPSERERYERLKKAAQTGVDKRSKKRLHDKINKLISDHTEQLSYLPVRVYKQQRKQWKDLCGKKFDTKMKHFAEEARHTIYHEYEIARSKQKKSRKGAKAPDKKRKVKGKRTKAEIKAAALANVEKMAKPKQAAKKAKISRGKHGEMSPNTRDRLAEPKFHTPKYVDESMHTWRGLHYVSEKALSYTPSPRIYELAVHKVLIFEPPIQLGGVEPDALTARASPRILEMAVPKARSAVQEADYNEDAFKVSPNALHYKATERIIELSKPLQRE